MVAALRDKSWWKGMLLLLFADDQVYQYFLTVLNEYKVAGHVESLPLGVWKYIQRNPNDRYRWGKKNIPHIIDNLPPENHRYPKFSG